EFAIARAVNLRTDHVRGQEIRRELNPVKRESQSLSKAANGERLGKTGNSFEKDMTAAEQADQQPVDHRALADDYLVHVGVQAIQARPLLLRAKIDFENVFAHRESVEIQVRT